MLYDMTPLLALCDNASQTAANAADAWSRAEHLADMLYNATDKDAAFKAAAFKAFEEAISGALEEAGEAYRSYAAIRDLLPKS